ncbi:MAG: ATP-binding cassette domain-containing protein, partial [Gammaproteobacteria bacterium]|nr:ATP-binding cassette domain-containing protein [Gammaproteobacteria bacterium]
MSLLSTRSLNISIADKLECKSLDINFEAGQVWGILGRNGVGKTTLLHTLCQLRTEFSGAIILKDKK